MRWAGYEARMGRRRMRIGFRWESQEERAHLEDIDIGVIILKWILKK
jgi:hypothetical protein